MKDFNDKARPPPDHQKQLVSLITELAPRHGAWKVFSDFVEMGAISISNAVDAHSREKRERRYMEIVGRYKPEEIAVFRVLSASVHTATRYDQFSSGL